MSERKRIYIFLIDDYYVFKQYVPRTGVFAELQDYYNDDQYRFEVPKDDLVEVARLLEQQQYKLRRIIQLEEFAVVKKQQTNHAGILRNAVAHWRQDGYTVFVMQSPQAIREAVDHGATRFEATDLNLER
ncbi:MAG: hypothetical protein SVG88_08840 [Halobacteriales archaeon]|nr:hypothetical protein [Halobacteriales archaeon]